MIPKRPRFRPIALLCALSAALVLYAGCFSSVTGDEDVSETVAVDGSAGSNESNGGAGGSSGNAGGNATDDSKNEAAPAARIVAASELGSLTAADLSREEFGDTYTIQLDGKWTDHDLKLLGGELRKITGKHITLDMAQTTGIESIGDCAFMSCTSLALVTIPAGVTSIEDSAFAGCKSLASVTIPAGVTNIEPRAFQGCKSLASVTIPAGVTSIGSDAFLGCTSLASVTIPEGVTSISVSAFRDCTSLASVTIPAGVTTIGNYAFLGCTSLASVTIPAGVTTIGSYAFYGCTSLASVTFADTSNWYATTSNNYTGGDPIDVTNPATNANNLKDGSGAWYDKFLYTTAQERMAARRRAGRKSTGQPPPARAG